MPVLVYPVASGGAGQGASNHLGELIKAQGSSLPCHQPWNLMSRLSEGTFTTIGLICFAAKVADPVVDHTRLKKTAVGNRTSHPY